MQTLLRTGKSLPAVCAAAEVSEDALTVLEKAADGRSFLGQLLDTESWSDGVAFLAHALPQREGVWWAWLCAREAAGERPAPAVAASLEATKTWIAEPNEPHRQAALEAAETAGIATPVGMAGLAAFLCGQSLGPENAPPAPPPEFAAAKAIAGCISLAAVVGPEDQMAARYVGLMKRGVELADRIQLWTPGHAPAPGRR